MQGLFWNDWANYIIFELKVVIIRIRSDYYKNALASREIVFFVYFYACIRGLLIKPICSIRKVKLCARQFAGVYKNSAFWCPAIIRCYFVVASVTLVVLDVWNFNGTVGRLYVERSVSKFVFQTAWFHAFFFVDQAIKVLHFRRFWTLIRAPRLHHRLLTRQNLLPHLIARPTAACSFLAALSPYHASWVMSTEVHAIFAVVSVGKAFVAIVFWIAETLYNSQTTKQSQYCYFEKNVHF